MMFEQILMVDDEDNVRKSTTRLLQRKGYHVEEAGSGAEALDKLTKKRYDLLILDIRMPQMSGLELLRQAKEMNPEIMHLRTTCFKKKPIHNNNTSYFEVSNLEKYDP